MQNIILILLLSAMPFGAALNHVKSPVYAEAGKNNVEFLSNNDDAAEFELKDQYNKSFSLKFPREKPTVLVFGDREGAKQIESWVRPLVEKYNERIDIQGVAELSAVPGIAQGVVRRIMKNQVKYSVMLDWSGGVSKSYGYQKGKANLFVIDKQGRIISKKVGAANQSELEQIYREINRIF